MPSSPTAPMPESSTLKIIYFIADNAENMLNIGDRATLREYQHLFVARRDTITRWTHIACPRLHAQLLHLFKLCAHVDPDLLRSLQLTVDGDVVRLSYVPTFDFSVEAFETMIYHNLALCAARQAAAYARMRSAHNEWMDWEDSEYGEMPELVDDFE
ncbi:hypothetical protein GGX14DRAFT_566561 [Mycena pura]|uniref:Uncharacterized protein n=1 Tax=Mycena pura TaxID=153505 RepID=A0AAD6YAR4_9AGAR|nr:hypothetical protein GGX14DRAFT_566561 [Mycena pura]